MRTHAEWTVEIAARRARLRSAKQPWLRELLQLLVDAAVRARRNARRRG